LHSIILAAGVGKRLESFGEPKCLLSFGGKTLLQRHLEALLHGGIEEVTVVVGHRQDQVKSELDRLKHLPRPTLITNLEFEKGSVVSLWTAREVMERGGDILLMDADVLCDDGILDGLVRSDGNVFLLDRDFDAGDEPVKLCVRNGGLVEFRKQVPAGLDYDFAGESVGFFRFTEPVARKLVARCQDYVSSGRVDEPHEEAIRDVLLESPDLFSFQDVTGVPWIEIDFPGDVGRAERDILPRLATRRTAAR